MDKFYIWMEQNHYGTLDKGILYLRENWNIKPYKARIIAPHDLMLIGYKLQYLYENGYDTNSYYLDHKHLDSLIEEIK